MTTTKMIELLEQYEERMIKLKFATIYEIWGDIANKPEAKEQLTEALLKIGEADTIVNNVKKYLQSGME